MPGQPLKGCPEPARRLWLKTATAAVFAAAAASTAAIGRRAWPFFDRETRPFAATFRVARSGHIRLAYRDTANFSLHSEAGPGVTIVKNGQIYLHIAPSVIESAERLLLLGSLGPMPPHPGSGALRPSPVQVSQARLRQWGLDAMPLGVAVDATERQSAAGNLFLADLPDLADAQYAIVTRLRDAMNMSMCGDVLSRLLECWPSFITGAGKAVLAHSAGVELVAPPGPLLTPIELPPGLSLEDYRLSL